MQTPNDLFESTESTLKTPEEWFLVTNQRNLLYMLAAGLLMPPKGFGTKYYQDTLGTFPGWVPLFADSVPEAAIKQSIEEQSHLIPCIASLDLSSLGGRVMVIDETGEVKDAVFPEEIGGDVRVLLIPAPLPVSWIESINFPSRDEKTNCETDARDLRNVPLKIFKRNVNARLFSENSTMEWPPQKIQLDDPSVSIDAALVAGCMMTMLLHLANLGETGEQVCRLAFDSEASVADKIANPMISTLGDWLNNAPKKENGDVLQGLFWGAIDKLVDRHSSAPQHSALDLILEHLESIAEQLDERLKKALARLVTDLKTLARFSDSTITELFERHPKSFSRVLTLFFLREDCADLLEFRHPLLTEEDYLAAAILFSAREGWLNLQLELRDYPGLQEAVPHRMAALAHLIADTGIELGMPPKRPIPLRELFNLGSRGWVKTQKEAALALARDGKWSCIQTRITLGKGNYRLEVDSRGAHVLIAGEAKAVVTEVDIDQFFSDLAQNPPTAKQVRKVFKLLKI